MDARWNCVWCGETRSIEDIAGGHGVCEHCRTANHRPTLSRVGRFLAEGKNPSQIAGWGEVRELAGSVYGHALGDLALLDRICGKLQLATGFERSQVLTTPLARVAAMLIDAGLPSNSATPGSHSDKSADSDNDSKKNTNNSEAVDEPLIACIEGDLPHGYADYAKRLLTDHYNATKENRKTMKAIAEGIDRGEDSVETFTQNFRRWRRNNPGVINLPG